MTTANDVLRVAASQIGYSRWDDPLPGTKYGRWYADLVGDASFGASGVPYCAMGASWTFAQVNGSCAGFPGAYTPTMLSIAKSKGMALSNKKDARPGDVVYFNWDGGVVDHVGFVEINAGSYIQTIEFNTGNGRVLRRTRDWGTVEAVVRPYYDGVSIPSSPSAPPSNDGTISEDGWWGPDTTRKLQSYLGTTPDGIISGQDGQDMRNVNAGGLQGNTWKIGSGGSDMVYTLQQKIGATPDRYFGKNSCLALQRYLGTPQDGRISGPSMAVRELQRRLNAGTF